MKKRKYEKVIEVKLKTNGSERVLKGPEGVKFSVSNIRYVPSDISLLLTNLPKFKGQITFPQPGNNPLVPACVAAYNPDSTVYVHEMDSHDYCAMVDSLGENNNIEFALGSDLQESEGGQMAIFKIALDSDRLLCFDILERLNKILPDGSPVMVLLNKKRQKDFIKKLMKDFGKGQVIARNREAIIFQGVTDKKKDCWSPRTNTVLVDAIGAEISMDTRPGVFSHGRVDSGGLALYETLELAKEESILELGCGAGLVGLLAVSRLQEKQEEYTGRMLLVDSFSRAIDCATSNVEKTGLKNIECLLSDNFETDEKFDVVAGNPPYYANHRIAEYFIETAATVLKKGGRFYLVSKHGDVMEELASEMGFEVKTVHRRKYDVLIATKK